MSTPSPGLIDLKIMVLGAEVDAELRDPAHLNRTHGTISCYNTGKCRGPLCRYARRIHQQKEDTQTTQEVELEEFLAKRLAEHHADHDERLANRRRA